MSSSIEKGSPQTDSKGTSQRKKNITAPEENPVEEDPAVERGERIHTGKQIARGGKAEGEVPGATDQSS